MVKLEFYAANGVEQVCPTCHGPLQMIDNGSGGYALACRQHGRASYRWHKTQAGAERGATGQRKQDGAFDSHEGPTAA